MSNRIQTIALQTEPEVPLPGKFRGTRKCSANDFKDAMTTIFILQPLRFPTDAIKILYVSTFFQEAAQTWFKALRDSNDESLSTLQSFWSVFDARFGKTFVKEEAEFKLLHASQRKNERVDEFNNRFLQLTNRVSFDDAALRGIYMKAINSEILQGLYRLQTIPATLNEAMKASELIDSQNRQLNVLFNENTSRHKPTFQDSHREFRTDSNAMDISNIRVRKIDSAEKQRRIDNHLCLYCGDADHLLEQCKKKPRSSSKNFQARR